MSRRVIQLCAMASGATRRDNTWPAVIETYVNPTLYALCEDGSVWAMDGNHDRWLSISTKSIREGHEVNGPRPLSCVCDECEAARAELATATPAEAQLSPVAAPPSQEPRK